jgi:hypothetical protein
VPSDILRYIDDEDVGNQAFSALLNVQRTDKMGGDTLAGLTSTGLLGPATT